MDPLKRNTGKLAKSMASHFKSIYNAIIFSVILLVLSALPLAALIIGALRINNCPIQPMIPIWLIVTGVIGVAGFALLITTLICRACCCYEDDSDEGYIVWIGLVICIIFLFYCAWMIAGCVWIFGAKPTVQFDDSTATTTYCHQSAYNYAFGLVITQLCLAGLFQCLCCCGICLGCWASKE